MINQLSHSLHVSSGEHTISNSKQLRKVANHNSRKFSKSNNPRLDLNKSNHNHTIIGSDNIVSDVKSLYEMTFNDSVVEYNSKQKRNDRKIDNYFNHIDNSKQSNLAEEIIVQFGGVENFEGIDWNEDFEEVKNTWIEMFENYTNKLNEELPNFKIANATIHFDETTPHLHIVGIPIKEKCNRGVSTQISKSSVFTREGLSELQKNMKNYLAEQLNRYFNSLEVKETTKGRNKNFNTDEIIKYKRELESLKRDMEDKQEIVKEINGIADEKISIYLERDYPNITKEIQEELIDCSPYLKKSILKGESITFADKLLLKIANGENVPPNINLGLYSDKEQDFINKKLNDSPKVKKKSRVYDFEM